MPAGIRNGLLVIYAVLMMALPAYAEMRTFAYLLAQAKLQAATGHRWAPPGDNMTETVMRMMDMISTATPAQLSELSGLLAGDKTDPPPSAASPGSLTEERPAQALPAPSGPSPGSLTEERPAQALPAPSGPSPGSLTEERPARALPAPLGPSPGSLTEERPARALPAPSAPSAGSLTEEQPARPLPAPSASQPSPALVLAAPKSPPVLPNRPEPGQASPIVPGQAVPGPGSRAGVLFARGLDAELRGDLSGARRFYLGSANQGDAAAARNLGRLYDPAYLKQNALGGVDPDPALARYWYERAVRFGDPEAGLLLEALSVR